MTDPIVGNANKEIYKPQQQKTKNNIMLVAT